jgi:hypothetical protein
MKKKGRGGRTTMFESEESSSVEFGDGGTETRETIANWDSSPPAAGSIPTKT